MIFNTLVGEVGSLNPSLFATIDGVCLSADQVNATHSSSDALVKQLIDHEISIVAQLVYETDSSFDQLLDDRDLQQVMTRALMEQVLQIAEICEQNGGALDGIRMAPPLSDYVAQDQTAFDLIMGVIATLRLEYSFDNFNMYISATNCKPFHIFTADRFRVNLLREVAADYQYAWQQNEPVVDYSVAIHESHEIIERARLLDTASKLIIGADHEFELTVNSLCFDQSNHASMAALQDLRG